MYPKCCKSTKKVLICCLVMWISVPSQTMTRHWRLSQNLIAAMKHQKFSRTALRMVQASCNTVILCIDLFWGRRQGGGSPLKYILYVYIYIYLYMWRVFVHIISRKIRISSYLTWHLRTILKNLQELQVHCMGTFFLSALDRACRATFYSLQVPWWIYTWENAKKNPLQQIQDFET